MAALLTVTMMMRLCYDEQDHESLLLFLSKVINTPPSFEHSPWEMLVCIYQHELSFLWLLLTFAQASIIHAYIPTYIQLSHNFEGRDATALVLRLHHVLADGLSLVTFMDAITQPLDPSDTKK